MITLRPIVLPVVALLALQGCATAPSDLASAPVCDPVEGWDAVLADQEARILVIGEMHGTTETPPLFADLVCLTGQEAQVVVAIEQPASSRAAISAFMASDGGPAARTAFMESPIWQNPFKDGRSSQAMFAMFDRLRTLHHAGLVSRVVPFIPAQFEGPFSPERYEQALAMEVVAAGVADSRTLVLTGNIHARRTEISFGEPYLPMAGHLPATSTRSFDTAGWGGEMWACSGPETCGPIRLDGSSSNRLRGVDLNHTADGAFNGTIHLGSATTASAPQVPNGDMQ